jgi:hypothetical protein
MSNEMYVQENQASGIVLRAPWRVVEVRPLEDWALWVKFMDETTGVVCVKNFIFAQDSGVFGALCDIHLFNQV